MTFAQRRNRLMTHFSEIIPVVKRRMTVRLNVVIPVRCVWWGDKYCRFSERKKETPCVSVSLHDFAKTSLVRYFEIKTDTLSP